MAVRVALLHPSGIVVNVFMAAEENPAINSGRPDSEGRVLVSHADAQIGDRILKGAVYPRVKVQAEIDAESVAADPVVGGDGEAKP